MRDVLPVEDAAQRYGLVGDSPLIRHVLRTIEKLKGNRSPVLIQGETGTGKELVARALHATSPGTSGAFVAVNLAALPPALIESELFGYTRGTFTGADRNRAGLIEQAGGGTLFLDEIGEFPLELQAKVLRVLEQKEIRPLGSDRIIPVNVRLIAATNRDLNEEVQWKRFRMDLFHRLSVVPIRLPPLRDRREDIPALALYFLQQLSQRPLRFSDETMECLTRYDWPGNVRQLRNCIETIVALYSGSEIHVKDLPTYVRNAMEAVGSSLRAATPEAQFPSLAELERLHIQHALEVARGDIRRAARMLAIGKTTLYRKVKEYGLNSKARGAAAGAERWK